MKGGYKGENTDLVYDMLQHAEQYIPGLLLLIDFEKLLNYCLGPLSKKHLDFLSLDIQSEDGPKYSIMEYHQELYKMAIHLLFSQ